MDVKKDLQTTGKDEQKQTLLKQTQAKLIQSPQSIKQSVKSHETDKKDEQPFANNEKKSIICNIMKNLKKIIETKMIGPPEKTDDRLPEHLRGHKAMMAGSICMGFACFLLIFGFLFQTYVEKAQAKETVQVFFNDIANANIEEIETFYTGDGVKYIEELDKLFDSLADKETYGEEFSQKVNKFKMYLFKNIYSDVSISDATKNDGVYFVTVKGKSKTNFIYDNQNVVLLIKSYQEKNQEKLKKIHRIEGKTAMIHKIYGDLSDDIIKDMEKQLKDWKTSSFISVFTVSKENGQYLISKIQTKNSEKT